MKEVLRILALAMALVVAKTSLGSKPSNEQITSAGHERSHGPEGRSKTTWLSSLFPDTISVYTLFLVLLNAVLSIVSVVQLGFLNRAEKIAHTSAEAAQESADVSRLALLDTQRPFVYVSDIQMKIKNNTVRILPKLENTGVTPAIRVKNYESWRTFSGPPGEDFKWADIGPNGEELQGPGDSPETFLGPKDSMMGDGLNIPKEVIVAVRDGKIRLFVWGWVAYDDMFDKTPRHETHFSGEIRVEEFDTSGPTPTVDAEFSKFGRNNRAN